MVLDEINATEPILGGYTRYDVANSPEGFIPEGLPVNLKDTFNIYNFKTINYGISVGYAYTFVIHKRIFFSLSLVPGFGSKTLVITTNHGTSDDIHGVSSRFISRVGLGYEHKYFYLGLGALSSLNSFKYKTINTSTSTTKFRFYIGKRFNLKKKDKVVE